jgi:hypothetical protein
MGHKRTNHHGLKSTFVRFGPKADKRGRGWIVRYVPIADSCTALSTWDRRAPVSRFFSSVNVMVDSILTAYQEAFKEWGRNLMTKR